MDFKERIMRLLEGNGIAEVTLEVPPNPELGDYAFPCFPLAKELKKAPPVIAAELATRIGADPAADFLERVVGTGPYVNFFIKPAAKTRTTLDLISGGRIWQPKRNQRILIEYPSPNTNKPLHLGHVRNVVLGSTLMRVLARDGNKVITVNLVNDRGVHICKSMLAYQRWGNGKEPDKKSDHFVGDFYVLFSTKAKEDPTLEEQAQAMLVKWEQGDPETRALWKRMNTWALEGFKETFTRYGISFTKEYYESDIYQKGKQIVLEHLSQLKKDESGAVMAELGEFKLPDKVLLRKDGTSIYMTQDIALTIDKMEEFHPDKQIWVVANEQMLHFQQLFAILELFGVKGRESFYHLSYGMVALPSGRMKSREGTVVDADDILDEMEALAAEEIGKRHEDWSAEQVQEKAKVIAMGAIRFFIIKFDPMRDFVFDPASSLSFEGDSGPYLQYTHARICSILAKSEYPREADLDLLTAPEEQELVRQLALLPAAFRKAADEYKLHLIANQLLEIGRAFNSFYHACPVLNAAPAMRDARLHLIEATRRAIDEGLDLLGIVAPREM